MKLSSLLLAGILISQAFGAGSATPVALQPYKGSIAIANRDSKNLVFLDPSTNTIRQGITLSAPPNGFCLDGDTAYISMGGPAGKVAIIDLKEGKILGDIAVGHTPMSPVKHEKTLYVPNRFSSTISVIDLDKKEVVKTLTVPREPVALAISPDGKTLWAANHLPAGPADGDFTAAELTRFEGNKVTHFPLDNGSQGVRGMAMSPDGKYLAITHILSRYQVPTTQLDRGWMNTNAVTIFDTSRPEHHHAILLDDTNQGAANPWGVQFTPDGKKLITTHAGTHEASIIDFPGLVSKIAGLKEGEKTSESLGFLNGIRTRHRLPLNGPRSLATDGTNLYSAGYFSDNVVTLPLKEYAEPREVKLPDAGDTSRERLGEQYFNDATLCFQEWQSCASCHPDARVDGLDWDLLNDGMGNPKNTRSMFISHRTSPVMSLGVRASAEVAVNSGFIHIQFINPEKDHVECVNEYLLNMKEQPSPLLLADKPSKAQTKKENCAQCHAPGVERGSLSDSARRGKDVFKSAGCIQCHPHPYFTTKQLVATGTTKGLDEGKKVLVPSLVEVWRTAPYMHDGRTTSIKEVITKYNKGDIRGTTSNLTEQQINDLVDYVRSL